VNLAESLAVLRDKVNKISAITEDKGHLDHPEDLIFLGGSEGANRALQAAIATVKNPKTVTIKWDGYPALIFGRNSRGQFSIMDKHMFNKKDGSGRQVFSPEQFVQYDQARGVDRSGLHSLMAEIWPGLKSASSGGKGYYWGDLLFSQTLQEQNGMYTFKANPKGIAYKVVVDSDLGRLMTGKQAGIAVHQYLDPNAMTTDDATPLNGSIGQLKNNSNVAIVPSAMPITPKIKLDTSMAKDVTNAISKYGAIVDQFMDNAPQARNTFNQLFTVFINKRIVEGNLNDLAQGFMDFVKARPMTESMKKKLLGYTTLDPATKKEVLVPGYLQQNTEAIKGAFTIWVEMYKLKMSIVEQLNKAARESPVKGYLDDGTETHEGFVSNGLKFVDRMGFSRQNLAGR
jgi:hypothetical protein